MRQTLSINVPPKAKPRGVAVINKGGAEGAELFDDLSPAALSRYCKQNAAIAFWLDANAYASVIASAEAEEKKVTWEFDYQVCNCTAITRPEAEAPAEDSAEFSQNDVTHIMFCGGQILSITCPVGHSAVCNVPDNAPPFLTCKPNLSGESQ